MNRIISITCFISFALLLVSCGGEKEERTSSDRQLQYFPNMYVPVSYETYQEADVFPGGVEAQEPVEGTVSRGWMPYGYEDTNEGYDLATAELKNPLPYTEANYTNGKAMYDIYCAICHGAKGDGQGKLVKNEKILGVPSYADRPITEGSIYHVMYYGINNMGSYAVQTSIEERWQITHYVDDLRAALKKEPKREFLTEAQAKAAASHNKLILDVVNDVDSLVNKEGHSIEIISSTQGQE